MKSSWPPPVLCVPPHVLLRHWHMAKHSSVMDGSTLFCRYSPMTPVWDLKINDQCSDGAMNMTAIGFDADDLCGGAYSGPTEWGGDFIFLLGLVCLQDPSDVVHPVFLGWLHPMINHEMMQLFDEHHRYPLSEVFVSCCISFARLVHCLSHMYVFRGFKIR